MYGKQQHTMHVTEEDMLLYKLLVLDSFTAGQGKKDRSFFCCWRCLLLLLLLVLLDLLDKEEASDCASSEQAAADPLSFSRRLRFAVCGCLCLSVGYGGGCGRNTLD